MCRLSKFLIFDLAYWLIMKDHPLKKGPNDGRFQCSHGDKRYLLEGKIKTGPRGGHYQGPEKDPRYLLHAKSVKIAKK
jgi:hypothetical protein